MAYRVPPHDVGGEADEPVRYEEKEEEHYYGLPYYGRWIWAAARTLVDKNHISLTELLEKIAEVRARYETR